MRVPITTEALMAGAILKFETVDYLDMVLLMGGLSRYSNLELQDKSLEFLPKYLKEENGTIALKEGLSLDSDIFDNGNFSVTLRRYMEKLSGKDVKEYLDNLDLVEFILRKIGNGKDEETVFKYYNDTLLEIIYGLIESGYLEIKCVDMAGIQGHSFGSFLQEFITLTPLGRLYLFKKDYASQLENFENGIRAVGYDPCYLEQYIMANLDSEVIDILRVNNYVCFFLGKRGVIEELDSSGTRK